LGIHRSLVVGAIVALAGALVALVFLPARPRATDEIDRIVEGASLHLPKDPERRLQLARNALELLAEAGMSSLTYNAVAARSGIGTATLERHWTSRVDAVTDALAEVIAAHPVPDTGDLAADLRSYLHSLTDQLADPEARRVLRVLTSEAGTDTELAEAVRDRVLGPWAAALRTRLADDPTRLNVSLDHAFDQIMGPLYARALLAGPPPDHDLADSIVATVTTDVASSGA
ncbi:MAG: TetR/AcrR family transcriptional regulator C-terminal ligand-binding domain-containing protein, partial [Actinobacteria bacterium]|nr:TetR/AcrR family transcriptional regulator C-terminal ligand-binding domain-containing protein [Actinomycetota bacterium]